MKMCRLKFRAVNKDIFEAIKSGAKKIETRAATEKYRDIKTGDKIVLICGKNKNKFVKIIKRVEIFKSVSAMLKKYKVSDIHPGLKSAKELIKMYHSFLNYKEKLKKYGLVAMEL